MKEQQSKMRIEISVLSYRKLSKMNVNRETNRSHEGYG